MNTVGKPGKLGEHVSCVVSVSMLTEGWDANTVTHVLGVRAFGTQLLCEQVVGRGLRRMSYAANERRAVRARVRRGLRRAVLLHPLLRLDDERRSRPDADPRAGPRRARRLRDHVPAPLGYRYELADEKLDASSPRTRGSPSRRRDVPTKTENAPIVGESSIHTLDDLKKRRCSEVAFLLAKLTLEKYFRQTGKRTPSTASSEAAGFPAGLAITRRWLEECVTCKDNTFPQLLLSSSLPTTPPTGSTAPSSRLDDAGDAALSRSSAPTTPRLDPLRRLRHDPPRLRDPRRQVPRLPRRRRHRSWEQKMAQRSKTCTR